MNKICGLCKNDIASIAIDNEMCENYYQKYLQSIKILASNKIPRVWKITPCIYIRMHKNIIANYEEFIIETLRSDKCFDCGVNEFYANNNTKKIICTSTFAIIATTLSSVMLAKGYYFFVIIFAGINTFPVVFINVLIGKSLIQQKLIRNRMQSVIYSWWFFIFLSLLFICNLAQLIYAL
jgi:hypothetical protein